LAQGRQPINDLDKASLIHDIEYSNPQITQFQADNNMFSNLLRADYRNLPLALATRVAFLVKDLSGMMDNDVDANKYRRMKIKAYDKDLVDSRMKFLG
jgi:conjugal transfer/entry exclusion protein